MKESMKDRQISDMDRRFAGSRERERERDL